MRNCTSFAAGLAAACLSAGLAGPASADQKTSVTLVMSNFTDASFYAGQKTSDSLSSFHKCQPGVVTSCVNVDGQRSIPKNIGNLICLPAGTKYSIESSCQTLINEGSGNCQENSAAKKCGSGMIAIAPKCNWRTHSSSNASANWQWLLSKSTDSITIGCNQFGYAGTSSK